MKFLLGRKVNMAQVFDERGRVTPVTVIKAEPMVVTQVKAKEGDGYSAIQFGFGTNKESRLSKPQRGHYGGLGNFRGAKELRLPEGSISDLKVGDSSGVSLFSPGDVVSISGKSKGKGFQGVVKRHGFHGGSRTHGQKRSEREPGSIGGGGRAGGRVAKGMRMAGRMGFERVTVKNLKVVAVDTEGSTILVSGAVPGRRGTLLEIKSSNS